jgi:nicotinamidase-related amidase
VFLFVDHQTGLVSLVQDIVHEVFLNTILALADTAILFNIPTITTASQENGPNGPLLPELKKKLPNATFIARKGEINAWDNEEFVNAVKKTGKKKLIISGIVTDVCVAFLALSAKAAGYEVFVCTDASGTVNSLIRDAAWLRMQQSGIQLVNWFSIACELARDWRVNTIGLTKLFTTYMPSYAMVINSFLMSSSQSNNNTNSEQNNSSSQINRNLIKRSVE